MIKIETVYALNDEELQEGLNKLEGKIIAIEYQRDHTYRCIIETN
jgi:hypothetical protein